MAVTPKEAEKSEKIIRGLLKLSENRKCINCNSVGPQYVCSTFHTFVCVACSGVHREFSHRVKSVSMSTFSKEEAAALQHGGNEKARQLFLRTWDKSTQSLSENNDVLRLREFIKLVYVERRYTGERPTVATKPAVVQTQPQKPEMNKEPSRSYTSQVSKSQGSDLSVGTNRPRQAVQSFDSPQTMPMTDILGPNMDRIVVKRSDEGTSSSATPMPNEALQEAKADPPTPQSERRPAESSSLIDFSADSTPPPPPPASQNVLSDPYGLQGLAGSGAPATNETSLSWAQFDTPAGGSVQPNNNFQAWQQGLPQGPPVVTNQPQHSGGWGVVQSAVYLTQVQSSQYGQPPQPQPLPPFPVQSHQPVAAAVSQLPAWNAFATFPVQQGPPSYMPGPPSTGSLPSPVSSALVNTTAFPSNFGQLPTATIPPHPIPNQIPNANANPNQLPAPIPDLSTNPNLNPNLIPNANANGNQVPAPIPNLTPNPNLNPIPNPTATNSNPANSSPANSNPRVVPTGPPISFGETSSTGGGPPSTGSAAGALQNTVDSPALSKAISPGLSSEPVPGPASTGGTSSSVVQPPAAPPAAPPTRTEIPEDFFSNANPYGQPSSYMQASQYAAPLPLGGYGAPNPPPTQPGQLQFTPLVTDVPGSMPAYAQPPKSLNPFEDDLSPTATSGPPAFSMEGMQEALPQPPAGNPYYPPSQQFPAWAGSAAPASYPPTGMPPQNQSNGPASASASANLYQPGLDMYVSGGNHGAHAQYPSSTFHVPGSSGPYQIPANAGMPGYIPTNNMTDGNFGPYGGPTVTIGSNFAPAGNVPTNYGPGSNNVPTNYGPGSNNAPANYRPGSTGRGNYGPSSTGGGSYGQNNTMAVNYGPRSSGNGPPSTGSGYGRYDAAGFNGTSSENVGNGQDTGSAPAPPPDPFASLGVAFSSMSSGPRSTDGKSNPFA